MLCTNESHQHFTNTAQAKKIFLRAAINAPGAAMYREV
jgi:hypothetical protein